MSKDHMDEILHNAIALTAAANGPFVRLNVKQRVPRIMRGVEALARDLAEADAELEQANRHWLKANARLVAAGLEPVDAEPIDDDELHALVDETGS